MKNKIMFIRKALCLTIVCTFYAMCHAQNSDTELQKLRERAAASLQKEKKKNSPSQQGGTTEVSAKPRWAIYSFAFDSEEADYFLDKEAVPVEKGQYATGSGLSQNAAIRDALLQLGRYMSESIIEREKFADSTQIVSSIERFPDVIDDAKTIDTYESPDGQWYALLFLSAKDANRIKAAKYYPYIEEIATDNGSSTEVKYVYYFPAQ